MPRYVILYHATPPQSPRASHWDFMLEIGGALRTWALAAAPSAGATIPANALADHRLAYLTYEGPLSGERGSVAQWDAGEYELVLASDEELRCELAGRRLRGSVALMRDPSASGDRQRWTFLLRNK